MTYTKVSKHKKKIRYQLVKQFHAITQLDRELIRQSKLINCY